MHKFLNFSNGTITLNTSRNSGIACANDDDWLDSVLSGDDCNTSDFNLSALGSALCDGEMLSGYNVDTDTVEQLHAQITELLNGE